MSRRTFTITKPRRGEVRDLTALDATALACSDSLVITSPNSPWVPKPFLGQEDLQMRADGRYGYVDPYQWPQLFSNKYQWSVAIPAKSYYSSPSPMTWAWYTPCYADFSVQQDSGMGNLNRATTAGLKGLLDVIVLRWRSFRRSNAKPEAVRDAEGVHSTLKKMWNVIELSHLRWRDTVIHVADYQRVFLELYAMMDFYQLIQPRFLMRTGAAIDSPGEPRWLGAFTRAPLMAEQLFAAGVPVWLIREEAEVPKEILINDIVNVWEPSEIVIHNYTDPVGHFAWPFEVVWSGRADDEALQVHIRGVTYSAKDHGVNFNPCRETSQGVHRSTHHETEGWQPYTKPNQIVPPMKRDLWEVAQSVFLPAPISVMSAVFSRVKKMVDAKKLKTNVNRMSGLRFPDPGMMVAVQSSDTLRRYFANWLAIRHVWIQQAENAHHSVESPTSKEWRAFLSSTPADLNCEKTTASARERSNALKLFWRALPDRASGMSWAGDDSVSFRDKSVKVFKSIPPAQARAITWELCELHFKFDILALDQLVVPAKWKESPAEREGIWCDIFPPKTFGDSWNTSLPANDTGVLRTTNEHDKFHMLNALACLFSAWPGAPSHFHTPITPLLGNDKVQGAMSELLAFYVKTFYVYNGRPPICPRHLPTA